MRGIGRLLGILALVAAMGATGRPAAAGTPAPAIPAGAMLYAETPDLNGLLAQWEASTARKSWESGAARELFIRSRVFLKWEDRLGKLSALAGRELDLSFLRQLDARRAVLAVYDPGRREGLLAVETGPNGRAAADAVAAALEARDAKGTAYRGRFLEDDGVFLGLWRDGATVYLATSDRLLREVIRLRREGGGWSFPEAAAERPYALRLDLDLAAIRKTSYYHRYWVHDPDGEWTGCARALLVIARDGAGWTEERLFLTTADGPAVFPTAAAPNPGVIAPFWSVRRSAADDVQELLLEGVLRLPAERQAELAPRTLYQGTAYKVAAAETSDFERAIDQSSPDVSVETLWSGAAGVGTDLDTYLAAAGPWRTGWTWDAPQTGDARTWSMPGGGLTLIGENAAGSVGRFRELLTRALAAAYLTNPAAVAWAEAEPGVFRCREPVDVWLAEASPGVLLVASSAPMLAEARRLAAVADGVDAAAGWNLAAVGDTYRRLLTDMGQSAAEQSSDGAPRFMTHVVPSLLSVFQAVDRIRFVQKKVPTGIYERVDYLAAP
ncbi:MAG: hypothetical protein GX414_00600 [Acidobacteria bacterium]|nr:hypothetical protein [Acidobacteriota bacterium]